jgi:hypothetical protein
VYVFVYYVSFQSWLTIIYVVYSDAQVVEMATSICRDWNLAQLVPGVEAPQLTKEHIVSLQEKLENVSASHDELLECLEKLSAVGLQQQQQ